MCGHLFLLDEFLHFKENTFVIRILTWTVTLKELKLTHLIQSVTIVTVKNF